MTRVAAIVGVTAVGKTEVAVAVAERVGAEIVSIDSMQVYRGMDTGTAKPPAELLERVPHHLIDVFDPSEEVTVSAFQGLARAAIEEISGRGRLPMLVGGSGLYYRAVVDELRFPPRAPEVRDRLEDEAERLGPEALHRRLRDLDPAAAARIEPGNARRTVRALEVIEVTGRPFSENDGWESYRSIFDLTVVGLTLPRDRLYERVAQRVGWMLEAGLVDEARRVGSAGMSRTARQALGYRQILDSPGASKDQTRVEIVRATKRFVRRQESWFRSDPRIDWLDASDHGLVERIASRFESPVRVT